MRLKSMNDALANDNDINEAPLQSHKKREMGARFFRWLMHSVVRIM